MKGLGITSMYKLTFIWKSIIDDHSKKKKPLNVWLLNKRLKTNDLINICSHFLLQTNLYVWGVSFCVSASWQSNKLQ